MNLENDSFHNIPSDLYSCVQKNGLVRGPFDVPHPIKLRIMKVIIRSFIRYKPFQKFTSNETTNSKTN